jgi:hypothetical protein
LRKPGCLETVVGTRALVGAVALATRSTSAYLLTP